jgi:hypothetical protein
LKAAWVPGQGCIITQTDNKVLAITFIYSMAFDFLVLILTAYKLLNPTGGRSRLVELIFNDGLIYFVIASVFFVRLRRPSSHILEYMRSFLANLIATVSVSSNYGAYILIYVRRRSSCSST